MEELRKSLVEVVLGGVFHGEGSVKCRSGEPSSSADGNLPVHTSLSLSYSSETQRNLKMTRPLIAIADLAPILDDKTRSEWNPPSRLDFPRQKLKHHLVLADRWVFNIAKTEENDGCEEAEKMWLCACFVNRYLKKMKI
ncbi:unnamed protein product [Nippostrongylus brasiliensis]|uniref:Uncharacterized protein n=1 Tax=Nippostrongylus brasiliensis TaxID=27835 RepID=A0A0N4Y4C0_NIPBR|nr:hypothetical protein Q1695_003675 [Nippostrongylus brasiliensis]VDL74322.1 unnamed protein product [Nippostrongylus brasiliensis]